ncbi:MAG: hypothetical protein QNJ53_05090 [Pleurocapsa sp. MO_192.B19]|nr:hypothetical protein [Pleurocapsa sp. MO_192.B19]
MTKQSLLYSALILLLSLCMTQPVFGVEYGNSLFDIDIPFLKNTITDTHLDRLKRPQYPETRYGRLFGFLARLADDNGIPSS